MKTVNTPAGPVKVGDVVNMKIFGVDFVGIKVNGVEPDEHLMMVDFGKGLDDFVSPQFVKSIQMKMGEKVA